MRVFWALAISLESAVLLPSIASMITLPMYSKVFFSFDQSSLEEHMMHGVISAYVGFAFGSIEEYFRVLFIPGALLGFFVFLTLAFKIEKIFSYLLSIVFGFLCVNLSLFRALNIDELETVEPAMWWLQCFAAVSAFALPSILLDIFILDRSASRTAKPAVGITS